MTPRTVALERLIAIALVAVALLVHGPLFVRSPLGPDPVMYDLQAQLVQDGGVLYRDILEPNLPGAVWMHLAVRSVGGWSPEVLRIFDLIWVSLAAWLATRLIGGTLSRRTCIAMAIVAGYTTLSEWCHCQRDVWMLPLVLGAVVLRVRRLGSPGELSETDPLLESVSKNVTLTLGRRLAPSAQKPTYFTAILEGVLWGVAVWLKPHVVIPAGCVVVASWMTARSRTSVKQRFIGDTLIIFGGALIGALGLLWLVENDAWRPLWSMLTEWNRDYVAASGNRWSWERLWSVQQRLAPWSLVHVVAIPVAVVTVWRELRRQGDRAGERLASGPTQLLSASLYLGWVAQSLLLQHLFDYVHVPAIVFGVIVVAGAVPATWPIAWTPRRVALAGLLCLLPSIVVRGNQFVVWSRCVTGPASPELKATLARLPLPEWKHLEKVTQFLAGKGVQDGELTAYHTHTIHLYPSLGVRPSTRFVFTETHLRLFPKRAGEIAAALAESNQKYVVSDLLEAGLDPAVAMDDSEPNNWQTACPRDALSAFPFDQPVIFRSGPYLVHEVTRPLGPVETGFFPLAAKSAGL